MSTRSAIIQKQPDGSFRGIYCHHDGYLSHNGVVLRDHYQDPDKVTRLIDLGDISVLDRRVEPLGEHSYQRPEDGTVIASARDRGEVTNIEPKTGATWFQVAEQIGHNGHVYVFDGKSWEHNGVPLEKAIAAGDEGEEA